MKSLAVIILGILSNMASANALTCSCKDSAGCPERLTVTITQNEFDNYSGQVFHFGLVNSEKVLKDGDNFIAPSWSLSLKRSCGGCETLKATLNVDPLANEELYHEVSQSPTHSLYCH